MTSAYSTKNKLHLMGDSGYTLCGRKTKLSLNLRVVTDPARVTCGRCGEEFTRRSGQCQTVPAKSAESPAG